MKVSRTTGPERTTMSYLANALVNIPEKYVEFLDIASEECGSFPDVLDVIPELRSRLHEMNAVDRRSLKSLAYDLVDERDEHVKFMGHALLGSLGHWRFRQELEHVEAEMEQLEFDFSKDETVSVTYDVTIRFVDDSYWDDGQRWTTRQFSFATRHEVRDFISDITKNGLKTQSRVMRQTFNVDARECDITVFEVVKKRLNVVDV